MKNWATRIFGKSLICIVLIVFGFSLQSFNGYRIEKRHYRKGYYIHICHAPKTKPVYHVTETPTVKEEKPVSNPPEKPSTQQSQREEAPTSTDDNERGRNIAPVSAKPTSRAI